MERVRRSKRTPSSPCDALAVCAILALAACDPGRDPGAIAEDDGGPAPDTDSEIAGDVCENYPAADNDFLPGSVPRNYVFIDSADVESRLCDYADRRLALLVMSEGES